MRALARPALVISLLFSAPARAEVPTIPDLPTSPAFVALDVNPTVVTRPTSAGSLGAALATGVDADGRLVPGLAVDVAPVWLFTGGDKTLENWQSDYGLRLWSRLSLSLATARLPQTEQAVGTAAAIRAVLVDEADPRWDPQLATCVRDAVGGVKDPVPTRLPDGDLEEDAEHEKLPSIEECKTKARERSQDKGWQLAVAAAYAGVTPNGEIDDISSRSVDAWTDVAKGFSLSESWSLGLGSVVRLRYLTENSVAAADTGLALRIQLENRFRLNGAAVWKPQDLGDLAATSEVFAVGGKAELRLYSDTWASAEVTYQGGDDSALSGALALGQLRYAF